MSAVHSVESVDQLANALAPWPVVVHHDFSQRPDFKLTATNAHLIADPKKTGWAVWGFSEGILHLLKTCLDEYDADYFQLLSPTCLPVKPVGEFADYVANDKFDVHIGTADLRLSDDLEMNFGYRAYAPRDSFVFRALRKVSEIYFAGSDARITIANLQSRSLNGAKPNLIKKLARATMRAARRGWFGSHPFSDGHVRTMIGGTWFGCRRQAGEYLLARMTNDARRDQFREIAIPDEMMFASVFWSGPFEVGPPNHFVNTFDEHNPRWIETSELSSVPSDRYFARKFRDDTADPSRQKVLSSLESPASASDIKSKPSQPHIESDAAVN